MNEASQCDKNHIHRYGQRTDLTSMITGKCIFAQTIYTHTIAISNKTIEIQEDKFFTVVLIYHNVALRAPPKRAQRDSGAKTVKRDAFPGVNRKNASGLFSARCMTMHETEWQSVRARPLSLRLIFGSFLSVCVTFHARTHPSATTFNSPPLAHTQNTDGHTDVS
ncbi:hypothetical protein NOE45_24215 [Escherichia coli]|uniref:hypothetical protein n=1 Tax=Escherichia coli TaxID=562 RepID=UPI0021007CA2|nr:hypothetical protein [Escherichia coli]MCQ1564458.1 hypothetical protein [Escherichia coli]